MTEYERYKRMMDRIEDANWMYKYIQAQEAREKAQKENQHTGGMGFVWIVFFSAILILFIILLIVSVIKF